MTETYILEPFGFVPYEGEIDSFLPARDGYWYNREFDIVGYYSHNNFAYNFHKDEYKVLVGDNTMLMYFELEILIPVLNWRFEHYKRESNDQYIDEYANLSKPPYHLLK